ncbi:unnamed protein product [Durusdinium trenchii]|uniref:Uncharacterized protein n=1 Tax=Durusdinium trenchii TaxID=1381693 RepID=A0ABP0N2U5_9DINO
MARDFGTLRLYGFVLVASLLGHRMVTWIAPRGGPRARRECSSLGRQASEESPEERNLWREAPQRALADALARADAKWLMLQDEADATETDSAADERSWRAAAVMAESALDRLRPYTVPAKYVDIPPLRGSEEALLDFLGDDARLVFNFLSQVERLSPAGQAFWQAELYLRQLDEIAGETEVRQAAEEAKERVEAEPEALQLALRGSVLLARQNFISAARFGYFLQRSLQRLELERNLGQGASSLSDWMECHAHFGKCDLKDFDSIDMQCGGAWWRSLTPTAAVELARAATKESQRALQYHATDLFGSEAELLKQLDYGPNAIAQLQLSDESRRRLSLEAAAFGAALFDAECAAARRYRLEYTAEGSRADGPLG